MDNNEADVEAPPTYEVAKNSVETSEPEPSGSSPGEMRPRPNPERPCAARNKYDDLILLTIGIGSLVVTSMEFLTLFIDLYKMAFNADRAKKVKFDWKSLDTLIAVAVVRFLIALIGFVINFLLILGVKTKSRKCLIVWIYGTILIMSLILVKVTLKIIGGEIKSLIYLIGVLPMCYFIVMVHRYTKK